MPDQPAIVFDGGDTVTYAEFERWTDNVARRLVELGVQPGDRVSVVGPNSLEWCAAAVGALKTGAIVPSYNQRLLAPELTYLVSNSEPRIIVADEGHFERLDGVAAAGQRFGRMGMVEVAELRHAPHERFVEPDIDPDSPAVIVYTSGTTANPKGVVFTHRSIFGFILEWRLMEPAYQRGVRMIFVLSLAGCPGIAWAILNMLSHGGTLYLEKGFDPQAALQRMVDNRIQLIMGVPVLFEQMASRPEFATADLSSVESATVGGAPVPIPTLEAWLAKGVELRQIYGMTELGGTTTANSREAARSRPESVGTGSMFSEHRVVRTDGTDCEPGEPGEIIVRGPSVTPGYWRDEEATAKAIRNGWFHSGDLGVYDEDGHLRMVDRLKDLIISGGYNIAPSEIEEVIRQVDGVDEVAVVGLPDAKFGEAPSAIVYSTQPIDTDAVLEHCRKNLSGYKVPRHVFVSDQPLPRMPSGKLAKRDMRTTFTERVAGGEPVADNSEETS